MLSLLQIQSYALFNFGVQFFQMLLFPTGPRAFKVPQKRQLRARAGTENRVQGCKFSKGNHTGTNYSSR